MTVAFAGCSYVAGIGFSEEKLSPDLWVNNIKQFKNEKIVNLSLEGASNQQIFQQAIEAITSLDRLKYLVVCWTQFSRFSFNCGFELYPTNVFLSSLEHRDHNLNTGILPGKYLTDVCQRFRAILDEQEQIVQIIKFTNWIKKLAKNIEVIFVNSLCPWDKDFFVYKEPGSFSPMDLTEYTRSLLNVDNRDDDEIFKLYELQHQQYEDAGGLDPRDWVNLDSSFYKLSIDTNDDDIHPGTKSNEIFTSLIEKHIEDRM